MFFFWSLNNFCDLSLHKKSFYRKRRGFSSDSCRGCEACASESWVIVVGSTVSAGGAGFRTVSCNFSIIRGRIHWFVTFFGIYCC